MRQPNCKLNDPPTNKGQIEAAGSTVQQLHERPVVLVVDDDHLVRIMVQLGLERNGFDVLAAANGHEAIDLYRKHQEHIVVVLLDVRMPGLDGPATLDVLRYINPEVLVCFMSGHTGDYEPEELLRRGAARVIAKPFRPDHLADLLRVLVRGVPADLLAPGGE
jgi:CheY-like chemotaxis protein